MNSKNDSAYPGFVFTMTDAVAQASRFLGLDALTMASILQTDTQHAAALCAGSAILVPAQRHQWQRATDFVRLYCLVEEVNTNSDSGKAWLREWHRGLQERPLDALRRNDGLHRVLDNLRDRRRQGR